MCPSSRRPLTLSNRQRAFAACASGCASIAVLGVVLAVFDHSSSSRWLPDTPEAVAQAALCDQSVTRSERDGCMRSAAAHWTSADPQVVRVAASR